MCKRDVEIKWRDCGGGVVSLFGTIAGYTVCVSRYAYGGYAGLSFCSPMDRLTWNRDKGVALAMKRTQSLTNSVKFNEDFCLEDYVTAVTYSGDCVPQAIKDSVLENACYLRSAASAKEAVNVRKLNRAIAERGGIAVEV
jgi:hypothetical protein